MKRSLIVLVLLSIAIFVVPSFASESVQLEEPQLLNTVLDMSPDFAYWKNYTSTNVDKIYSSELVWEANLITFFKDEKYLGYLITTNDGVIIEYGKGASYYDYINDNARDGLLILDGTSKGFYDEETSQFSYLDADNSEAFCTFKLDNDYTPEFSISALPFKNKKVLSGVGYNQNNGSTPACGPVSTINILQYYDSRGYDKLITNESVKTLYDLLYYYMGCFQVNDGNHAASPFGPFENGIEKYCNDYKNYNFNAWSVPYVQQNHFNSFIKNQIDLNRPAIMLYKEYNNKKDGDYGLHYTDIVGYAYTTDTNEPYYIIHDLWSASDVYRNWNYDVNHGFLWMMFGITPN